MRSLDPEGIWPTDVQRLLLRATLLDGDEALPAWEEWRRRAGDIATIDVPSYRLLPQLYRNLLELGVDEPMMERLKGIYRHCWTGNQRLFHDAGTVLRGMSAAGLDTMILKGAALSALYYRTPGARAMDDIDVLVRVEDAPRAMRILGELGWTPQFEEPERLMAAQPGIAFYSESDRELDLHWSALWHPGSDAPFWQGAVPAAIGGAKTLALNPADQLVHVCVHGLSWWPAPVRWVADAVTVVRSADGALDWDRLVEVAAERRLTLTLATALGYLREEFGLPVPADAVRRLAAAPVPRHARLAHRMAMRRPRHGGEYVILWDRYRRLRTLDHGGPVPAGFADYLRIRWGLDSRGELPLRLLRKAGQIARYGRSHPSGERVEAR